MGCPLVSDVGEEVTPYRISAEQVEKASSTEGSF
jgi:hypothetical protein